MYAPMILKKDNRTYILEKVYRKNRWALYTDSDTDVKECFSFHELGLIEETEKID